ncbi:MAG TPA: pantoate--beta-alanine ligase [Opitutaceae bacterium]|jgi:pantoate--beta-alanine ligase
MSARLYPDLAGWRAARRSADWAGCSIGFVPTMGALHEGHRALLERARRECGRVVLSVFVNPTQFNDPKDLERYPRTLESDVALVGEDVDAVLAPPAAELYPDRYRFRVNETEFSRELEGAHRPGHFEGVLTVVLKLLNVVDADRAYFGEKDWQQLALVRGMAEAFFLRTQIIACPTVRAPDGLALSSRNARLSPAGRLKAPEFSRALRSAPSEAAAEEALRAAGFGVDYVARRGSVRLGAVHLDGVRLIDNVTL